MEKICLLPSAKNYKESTPCIVLIRQGETCYEFEEVSPVAEKLTLSYALAEDNWAYFHDYWPERYFRTRSNSYVVEGNRIYKMNEGPLGTYTGKQRPYIIDVVFAWNDDVFVDSIIWDTIIEKMTDSTFTHITVSSEKFTTGRRILENPRRIKGVYAFSNIRNIVNKLPYKDNVFNDYNILLDAVEANVPYYERGRLTDNYAIVRFEYNKEFPITFIGSSVLAVPSSR